jgi:hypothetical protein
MVLYFAAGNVTAQEGGDANVKSGELEQPF